MTATSLCAIVLTFLSVIPGEDTGWGTGEVEFVARVSTDEHKEIYPVCAGQYTVELVVMEVLSDRQGVLEYKTRLDVCYDDQLHLVSGDTVEVTGVYHDGACPLPFCGRVEAQSIYTIENWQQDPPDDDDDDDEEPEILSPHVLTGAIEATETSVTMQGILLNDGGESCRCRFIYKTEDGRSWNTEWQTGLNSSTTFSQRVEGLIPGTYYICWIEAENSAGWDFGRQAGFRTLEEKVPPIPHPAVWATEPDQVNTTSITMMADAERDLSGPQEYAFDFVSSPTGGSGGTNSAWQFSPVYVDVGLNPNHQYGYRVQARDGKGNETAFSPVRYAYTDIETPTGVTFGQVTTSSVQAKAKGTVSGLTLGQSGLKIENVTAYHVSEWQHENIFWMSEGLVPNTRYGFRAQARNGDGNPTGFSPESFVYTLAMIPAAVTFSDPATSRLLVHWSSNGNPAGTQYWCLNTVTNVNSGWTVSTRWPDSGLSPNVKYTYQVKARNGDSVETAFSTTAGAYSAIETPAGVTFGQITTSSVQAKASGTLSNLAAGQSGLRLENATAGDVSAWLHDNSFWTSESLAPNTRYSFRAQARNGDGLPTGFGPETPVYTYATVPAAVTVSSPATNQLAITWNSNGNPTGTQYWCVNTVNNANSGWIASMHWLNTGLSPNVKYTYQAKARNGDGVETALSAAVSSYSAIETPGGIAFGTITPTSIQVRSQNVPAHLDQGQSGLWFENINTVQNSSWRRDNNPWTSDGLLPNHPYSFRARARNGDGVQTPYCAAATIYTYANAPAAGSLGGITPTSIQVQWGTNGNPTGTLYLCENTTAGVNSGWITDTAWENNGLAPSTEYSYRVKARNADGVETAWTSLGSESTEYRSLRITSTAGGKVSSPALEVTRYAPGTTVDLLATPQAGYHFLEWTGTAVDAGRVADPTAAKTTVVVDAHYTLVANFLRTKVYVDARAAGAKDGSSWKNAFVSLQDALAMAKRGNEIYVAKGAYKPDTGAGLQIGDRFATFEVPSGVAVKGGYAGAANADPNTRNVFAYETILSGDLVGDDRPVTDSHDLYNPARRADNSFHVVAMFNASNKTLLEGFTITGGNGIDGAGICLIRSDPVVSRCTISVNRAGELSGDGLEGWGQGAGVSCYLCKPTFSECVFYANWAGGQGGAFYSVESSPTMKACVFKGNEAGMQGGAIYGQDSNSVSVDCTFHANWAWDGGALYHDDGSSPRLTNCRFFGNGAHGSGGAVFDAGLTLEIINSVFSGNLAYVDGGAVIAAKGPALITNCTFSRNVAQGKQSGQSLTVKNTTAALTNCILWNFADTTRNQLAVAGATESPAELIVSYSDVLGGIEMVLSKANATVTWGTKNLNVDPKFQKLAGADGVAGTEDDDLRLLAGSPCLDAGDNVAVPADADDLNANGNRQERIPFDLDAQARFVDNPAAANTGAADAPQYPLIVDLGAYEL